MGVSALESLSSGKKHKQILADRSKNHSMFFGKCSASSTEAEESVENLSSENTCNSLNAEVIWCLKVVNAHWSYNLSSDVATLFQCVFPDSEIASQFSMGKTKSRYMILYGLAPHFKSRLREAINPSTYYSLSFDESLNSVEQKCQMDVNVRFGMNLEIMWRLDITIQNFWIDLMLRTFLRVLEMHPMGCY